MKYKLYRANSSNNNNGVCHSCRYSIEIRGDIFVGNMRTFIWHGGTYPTGHVNAGQDWCFAFGENDWVGGRTHDDAHRQTERIINGRGRPTDINSEVMCP